MFRVGVIGLGMGKSHAVGVQKVSKKYPEVLLYSLCDIDLTKLQKTGAELGVGNLYGDYRDMLKDPLLDAVIIASPDQDHRRMAEDALAARKHVLCEKPLALTREDIEAIVAAAETSDKVFMVGQICRFTPGFRQAKELIEQGTIGDLTYVESEYAHDYTKIYRAGTWRSDPLRNGVVGGGCHAVDLLRWIAGDPDEVMAYGTHKTFAEMTPYDDTHISILRFRGGVIGKVFCSISCRRDYTMRSVFYGTKGTIITDNTSPSMTLFTYGESPDHPDGVLTETEIPIDIDSHNAAGEFEAFYDAIRTGRPVDTPAKEGANTIAVCHAIIKSSLTGQPVRPEYF
ncbi:MAG: Gfo/Idh/MocA family oxidoreductase [Firmicutes bacterium]|nr:Gfo/Idh/MocA family oxidoreductase [Bacillota bacterium]